MAEYNFNMLFQLMLTKFFKSELLSCLPKVDHVHDQLLQKYNIYIYGSLVLLSLKRKQFTEFKTANFLSRRF